MMSDKPRKVRDTNVVRFHQSGRNWLRITTVRVIVQTVVFAMFASFVLLTTFAHLDRHPGLRLWVSKVLEVDPLVRAPASATPTVYRGVLWSLVILIPTLLLGRFFCGWICPYGALHHFVGWAFGGLRGKRKIEANLYRPLFRLKYYILAAMLVAAVFGSLQVGLLDLEDSVAPAEKSSSASAPNPAGRVCPTRTEIFGRGGRPAFHQSGSRTITPDCSQTGASFKNRKASPGVQGIALKMRPESTSCFTHSLFSAAFWIGDSKLISACLLLAPA